MLPYDGFGTLFLLEGFVVLINGVSVNFKMTHIIKEFTIALIAAVLVFFVLFFVYMEVSMWYDRRYLPHIDTKFPPFMFLVLGIILPSISSFFGGVVSSFFHKKEQTTLSVQIGGFFAVIMLLLSTGWQRLIDVELLLVSLPFSLLVGFSGFLGYFLLQKILVGRIKT